MNKFLLTGIFGIAILSANATEITCKKDVLCMIQTPDNSSIVSIIASDKTNLDISLIGENNSTMVINSISKIPVRYSMIVATKDKAYPIDLEFIPTGKRLNILGDEFNYIGKNNLK